MDWDWTLPTDQRIERRREVVAYKNRSIAVFNDVVRSIESHGLGRGPSPGHPSAQPGTCRSKRGGWPGAAALATCDDPVALVLVYRYPQCRWEWGIPRGFAKSGDPTATIRFGLDEELSAEPRQTHPLGVIRSNSGLLAGHTALFHAEYEIPASQPNDRREVREVRWIPPS